MKRAGQQLAVLVVDHRLVQAPADALHRAAVDLALDQHRVEREADILDRDIVLQRDLAGVGIDRDFRQVDHKAGRVLLDRRAALADHRAGPAFLALRDIGQLADRRLRGRARP